ncbi:MAG TPA: aldo/keto reductase [Thermoplasmata archaeon]|nr:aldo/keto reductase [Thermoplasmata archaeon]
MQRVELGRSGIKVSRVGLGMWQAGGKSWGKDVNDKDCVAAMVRAHELGVNLIDTAEVYGEGHSEEVVGKAIKAIGRDDLVVATKIAGYHMRERDVERACRASLKRLGVKEIDVYQVHWPDPWDQVPFREGFKALERCWKKGLIRAIAVSNFAVRDLEDARSHLSRADIVSDQLRYNLLQREIETEVLPYCRREKISVLAWSPLAQGVLADTYSPKRKPKDAVRKQNDLFSDANLRAARPLLQALRRIARAHRGTVAQVSVAALAREPRVVPIPGAKRPAQAEENAGAAALRLTGAELRAIDAAARRVRLDTF